MVKFSYQIAGWEREQDLVKRAQESGVPHLPAIEMSNDLWTMTDGIRKHLHDDPPAGKRPEYDIRCLRTIMYHEYKPLKSLFGDHCLLIPVMVDQMIDCKRRVSSRRSIPLINPLIRS